MPPRSLGGGKRRAQIVAKADDPILYVERKAYLAAMRRMLDGVEAARIALAKASQRMER